MERGEVIELRAVNPNGDLACDITIADETARAGLREDLAAGMRGAPRAIEGGVEVPFAATAETAVRRYIELESKCCSFLSLAVERGDDGLLLRVTGRPDAQPFIQSIFAGWAGEPH